MSYKSFGASRLSFLKLRTTALRSNETAATGTRFVDFQKGFIYIQIVFLITPSSCREADRSLKITTQNPITEFDGLHRVAFCRMSGYASFVNSEKVPRQLQLFVMQIGKSGR